MYLWHFINLNTAGSHYERRNEIEIHGWHVESIPNNSNWHHSLYFYPTSKILVDKTNQHFLQNSSRLPILDWCVTNDTNRHCPRHSYLQNIAQNKTQDIYKLVESILIPKARWSINNLFSDFFVRHMLKQTRLQIRQEWNTSQRHIFSTTMLGRNPPSVVVK